MIELAIPQKMPMLWMLPDLREANRKARDTRDQRADRDECRADHAAAELSALRMHASEHPKWCRCLSEGWECRGYRGIKRDLQDAKREYLRALKRLERGR